MLRLIFFIFLTLILYNLLRLLFKTMLSSGKKRDRKQDPEELVQDPYCQTYIPKQSALKKKMEGGVLYFCSEKCMKSYIRREAKKD